MTDQDLSAVLPPQQSDTTPATPNTGGDDISDAELIAAARAASGLPAHGGEDGERPAPKTAGGKKTTPEAKKDAPKEPSAFEKLNAKLKERAETHRARTDYETKAKALEADRAAFAKEQADIQAERAKFERIRREPIAGLRDLGLDPDAIISQSVKEGSPEAKTAYEFQRVEAALKAQQETYDRRIKAIEDQRQAEWNQYNQMQAAQVKQASEKQFMESADTVAPTARLYYSDDESFLGAAYQVARACQAKGMQGISNDDILEYLEIQATERVAKIRAQEAGQTTGTPSKAQAKSGGKRALSQSATSERRSTPVDFDDLTPEQQERELVRVAREAKRAYRG